MYLLTCSYKHIITNTIKILSIDLKWLAQALQLRLLSKMFPVAAISRRCKQSGHNLIGELILAAFDIISTQLQ